LARWLRPAAILLTTAAAACGELPRLVALSQEIRKEFHIAANVAVNRRGTMRITFSTASLDSMQLDDAARETFARSVATFAKSHYSKSSELADIVIGSVAVSSTGGMVVTRTTSQYSFPARELK
jgi:hypothetical protein